MNIKKILLATLLTSVLVPSSLFAKTNKDACLDEAFSSFRATIQNKKGLKLSNFSAFKTKVNLCLNKVGDVPNNQDVTNLNKTTDTTKVTTTVVQQKQCPPSNKAITPWETFNRSGRPIADYMLGGTTQQSKSYSFVLSKTNFPKGVTIIPNYHFAYAYNGREEFISECPYDFATPPEGNVIENCSNPSNSYGHYTLGYKDLSETQTSVSCNLVEGKTYYLNVRTKYGANENAYYSAGYLYDTQRRYK